MKKWYQQKSFLITILLWFVGPIILIVVDGIAPFAAAPAIFGIMLIAGKYPLPFLVTTCKSTGELIFFAAESAFSSSGTLSDFEFPNAFLP